MEKKVDIILDSKALDNAIEKANRLIELLREVQQIADSLFGKERNKTSLCCGQDRNQEGRTLHVVTGKTENTI